MKFKVITFGCKVNTYESEFIKDIMLTKGFKENDAADIFIINTCTVTNVADTKCQKMIRRIRRENENAILVVCGCLSENHQENLNHLNIDILIGNKDKSKIPELINNYLKDKKKIIKFYDNKNLEFEDMEIKKFANKTRAFVKIQDGCNNYCSYCVIPFVRGNIRFKKFDDTVLEIKNLVKNGHKEIVLTGIHTGSYGRGLNYDLVDLIEEISKINDLKRIRISSIEITEITTKFLNMLKTNDKVCNHLHIPLQYGNDKILKLMNRKYDMNKYEKIINSIKAIRPNISVTTDVIMGFPNETEEDFIECKNNVIKLKFSKMHVFPYSRRVKTAADKMENHIDQRIKKDRCKELTLISNKLENEYYQTYLNEDVDIITEEVIGNSTIGFTSNYIKVKVNKILELNKIYNVKITKINDLSVNASLN